MDINEFLKREPNLPLARKLNRVVIVLTVVVLLLVGAMRQIKFELPEGLSTEFLPFWYSIINVCVAIDLIAALVFIKRRNVVAHWRAINMALICSILFLMLYVIYHFTNAETRFAGEGPARYIYFFFLITHVVLAAASFPFILYTWVLGFTNQFNRHRRFAGFVFPVWLYVAVTGPLCYLLLQVWGR